MSQYTPPTQDILFCLQYLAGLDEILNLPAFADTDREVVQQIIEEAAKFARDVVAPTNDAGDNPGCSFRDRAVTTPKGFAEAYRQFVENGWQTLSGSAEYDGMGMPTVVGIAGTEFWTTASLAFALGMMLTHDAAIAVEAHGSASLKKTFLQKLTSGEWTGTMNLTEPQAGSDLAAVTSKAVPEGDHYRITGTKIFISWGDHDLTDNILHLVLARLPDAPPGVKGISLFLVPKYLVNDDGSPGERNDVYPASIEHKLGIHGSPTCVMSFGDGDGAIAYLVGPENRGLACMFTMMNAARLGVGMQGLAISERAYQLARDHARDRVQGRVVGKPERVTIIHHPDVRRMLMLMRSQIEAMRAVIYPSVALMDIADHGDGEDTRSAAGRRLALMTPIVKGWLTELAQEVTSLGIQIHGGMGYVEETGAAQHYRDARILTIYEGTTGIQANDLTGRKILADEGREIRALIAELRELQIELQADAALADMGGQIAVAIDQLEHAVDWLLAAAADPQAVGSAAVNLLMLAGTVLGGTQLARSALIVSGEAASAIDDDAFCNAKIATAQFYCDHVLPRAQAYSQAVTSGPASTMALDEDAF